MEKVDDLPEKSKEEQENNKFLANRFLEKSHRIRTVGSNEREEEREIAREGLRNVKVDDHTYKCTRTRRNECQNMKDIIIDY